MPAGVSSENVNKDYLGARIKTNQAFFKSDIFREKRRENIGKNRSNNYNREIFRKNPNFVETETFGQILTEIFSFIFLKRLNNVMNRGRHVRIPGTHGFRVEPILL